MKTSSGCAALPIQVALSWILNNRALACRQPPHKAHPGSTPFYSVFHPSDAASSAQGDHIASKAGRLGGDDAGAAADGWLLEEGSGASPDNLSSLWKHRTIECNALHVCSLALPARLLCTLRGALLPLQDTAASRLAQTQRKGMPQMPLSQAAGTQTTTKLAQDQWTLNF